MIAILRQKCEDVRLLRFRWSTSLTSSFRWDSHQKEAVRFANSYTNNPTAYEFLFVPFRDYVANDNIGEGTETEDQEGLESQDSLKISAELLAEAFNDEDHRENSSDSDSTSTSDDEQLSTELQSVSLIDEEKNLHVSLIFE